MQIRACRISRCYHSQWLSAWSCFSWHRPELRFSHVCCRSEVRITRPFWAASTVAASIPIRCAAGSATMARASPIRASGIDSTSSDDDDLV